FTTEIGKAVTLSAGNKFAIITYGLGVHWALDYIKNNPECGANLIDLRTLQPWDKETVAAAVKSTGRVLILHEDTLTNGFGAEISAWIGEHCFQYLDAPVLRCASLGTAIPMSKVLEDDFLAKARLAETIDKLLKY
ncbi:MAG: dehydrogenase, partial [Chitinophagaceae bacterium]